MMKYTNKFKSLDDTFIYKHLNKNNGLAHQIMAILKNGKILTKENVAEAMLIINKNFKIPIKHSVLTAFENGEINLIYSPENVRVPTSMPFFLTKHGDSVSAVVVVDTYGKMDKETGNVEIDARKLYTMMEAAYFTLLYYRQPRVFIANTGLLMNGSLIYSNMFTKVLNRKYSLNVDASRYNKVIFLSSKFFMLNVLGARDTDMITNYAMKNCPTGNSIILRDLNDNFPQEAYTDLSTFITELAKEETNLRMSDLTVRGYLEQFINMYDSANLFSLEHLAYLIYNINAVLHGAYINNRYVLEDIVDKWGAKIYNTIVTIKRNEE